jgi:4-hydroxy-2-oxoheptanedioate aldolase
VQPNRVKVLWRENRTAVNLWLTAPDAWIAEVMAHAGPDAITIDLQHGLIDYQVALAMLQAISATPVVPFARLNWNDPASIMRLLDAGAFGLICPLVNTRAAAEAFVGACRYPPHGYRSYGPTRAALHGGEDYVRDADDGIARLAMIETAEALQNLDEIASTPGLDGLYVGPWDLSLSLGIRKLGDFGDAALTGALDDILAAASRHNLVPGIHAGSPEHGVWLAKRGFRFVTVASDTNLLRAAAEAAIKNTRVALEA